MSFGSDDSDDSCVCLSDSVSSNVNDACQISVSGNVNDGVAVLAVF